MTPDWPLASLDVIVVGCGVAGLSAAVAAAEAGAKVAVSGRSSLEERGGNTRYTTAAIRMKSEEAVADDFEQRFTDNSGYHVAPDLIEATVLDFDNWPGLDGRDLNPAVQTPPVNLGSGCVLRTYSIRRRCRLISLHGMIGAWSRSAGSLSSSSQTSSRLQFFYSGRPSQSKLRTYSFADNSLCIESGRAAPVLVG